MPVEKRMPKHHFNNVVRWIKSCPLERVESFHVMCLDSMTRLELQPDPSKAVVGVPDGSDAVDFMSIKVWMDGVKENHRHAIRQIVAFDATVSQRLVH